jgi:hypothetical protein
MLQLAISAIAANKKIERIGCKLLINMLLCPHTILTTIKQVLIPTTIT